MNHVDRANATPYTEGMTNVTDLQAKDRVAANVQWLLKKRGLSGRALSRLTGDPVMRISDVIRAEHVPNIGVLTRIAAALDTTVDFLVMHEVEENSELVA